MAVITSVLFTLGVAAAVIFGPQTRSWTWGPALVLFAAAIICGLPAIWNRRRFSDTVLLAAIAVTGGWIAWRGWLSPVAELATADLLLWVGAAASFVCIRIVSDSAKASAVFYWGITVLIGASVYLILRQTGNPDFNPVYPTRPGKYPSGFFGHYNECANFLLASSFLLFGAALSTGRNLFVRIPWILVAFAGFGSIYLTHSRSGMLAASIGFVIMAITGLVPLKRANSRWFVPLLIGLPVIALMAGTFLLSGWGDAQTVRSEDTGVEQVLDNSIRLHLWGIAFSCISLHPWAGGGSRSYSWECFQFWDFNYHGWQQLRPEFAHNEFLQLLSDYGIVGGMTVVCVLFIVGISSLTKLLQSGESDNSVRVGALAALSAILVMSSINFALHLLPGAVFFGICIGSATVPDISKDGSPDLRWNRFGAAFLISVPLAIASCALIYGIKGSRVLYVLFGPYFHSKELTERVTALHHATWIWPQASLSRDLASALHGKSMDDIAMKRISPQVEQTLSTYRKGLAMNPFDLTMSVNLAGLLSYLELNDEALIEYTKAIRLQGGMEMGFGALRKTTALLSKIGEQSFIDGNFKKSAQYFERGIATFTSLEDLNPAYTNSIEGQALKISILDGFGRSIERQGNIESALAFYKRLASEGLGIGNYRAGLLLAVIGDTAYSERRPSEAHSRYLEARSFLTKNLDLPRGTTPVETTERLAYINRMIEFFETTRVLPLEKTEN